jgi:hypothetical protein
MTVGAVGAVNACGASLGLQPPEEILMRPVGMFGVVLIVLGAVVLAVRGVSYTKDRHSTNIGPVQVSTSDKGFVPPVAGAVAIIAGVVLIAVGRQKSV